MTSLCWIRRDLRLHDHAALSQALAMGETHIAFIFDRHILEKLSSHEDRRITFIYLSLQELEEKLQSKGSSLHILYGKPEEEIPKLAQELKAQKVFCNQDYEPYAKERDSKVEKKLQALGIVFEQFKDSVIFEKREVLTNTGGIYKVFTPYKNKWMETFEKQDRELPDHKCDLKGLACFKNPKNILDHNWYEDLGFKEVELEIVPGTKAALKRLKSFDAKIDDYGEMRDFPAKDGTSGLSPYLRFGNLSIRDMVRAARDPKWLSEIIWRDFYQMILDAFPRVAKGPFKAEYAQIKWLGDKKHFNLWCEGRTGFPIVDAAMRCLNQTGLMPNRLRMVTASFLSKTLLIDWQWGEKYFAENLLDFDLASNNGGWQWCSSSGVDGQPYFRIFNPYNQSQKFDPEGVFIRKWCPELAGLSDKAIHYGIEKPIVSYEANRITCMKMYSIVKK